MDVPEIDVDELEHRLATGATLVDVREPDEYEQVRVPGGILVPLQSVPERLGEVPSEGTFYVICAKGGRSMAAAEFLRAEGRDAVNVAGGTTAWVKAGLPTESGSPA
jgi:rhodanese-related sulfurtransferase